MLPTHPGPANIHEMIESLKHAAMIDVGGLSYNYKQQWSWVTDWKDLWNKTTYSDMWELDAGGMYRMARRSNWNEKKKQYETIESFDGRLPNKQGLKKIPALIEKLVEGWYFYSPGGYGNKGSWKPSPWR
jgi:hypothetical protein